MKQNVAAGLTMMAALCLSGCAGLLDPYQREGTYSLTYVNDANLKAMLVNPTDFEHGTGAPGSMGQTAAVAVSRLRADAIKPLGGVAFGGSGGVAPSGGGSPGAGGGGGQ